MKEMKKEALSDRVLRDISGRVAGTDSKGVSDSSDTAIPFHLWMVLLGAVLLLIICLLMAALCCCGPGHTTARKGPLKGNVKSGKGGKSASKKPTSKSGKKGSLKSMGAAKSTKSGKSKGKSRKSAGKSKKSLPVSLLKLHKRVKMPNKFKK